jgi:hypothetical protein
MSDNHIYSKKEISKILNKASQIQTQKDLYGDQDGLTEKEILDLANEVGIDTESLLEAIQTYDKPEFDQKFKMSEITSKIQDVAYVDGEMTPELWDDVIDEIRKVTGGIGKSSQKGKSFEWEQRRKEFGYKHISLSPQNGKTKIQYVHNWTSLKFMILFMSVFLGSVFMLVLLKGLGMPKFTAVLYAPLGGLTAFLGSSTFLKYHFSKEKRRLKNIINAISKKLRSSNNSSIRIEDEEVLNELF